MLDAFGRELNIGDTILIPHIVEDKYLDGGVYVRTVATLPGAYDYHSSSCIDPRQVIRANPGDDTAFVAVADGGNTILKPAK